MDHRYVIRPATEDDCDAIFKLIMELAVFEKAPEQVTNTVEGLKKDGFGEKSFFHCIVVETDVANETNGTKGEEKATDSLPDTKNGLKKKAVIGFALFFYGYSTWSGRLVYLEDLYVSPVHRGLKKDGFGERQFFKCLVAETASDDGSGRKVIGHAIYYFGYSTWSGRLVYLDDLGVSSKHRGAGVGTALLKRVAGIGAEVGCVRMQFVFLGWNTGAERLYKRLGTQDLTATEDWHVATIRHETFIKVAKDSTKSNSDHIHIIE